MTKFYMRQRPKRPERRDVQRLIEIRNGMSIQELMRHYRNELPSSTTEFRIDTDEDEIPYCDLYISRQQTDEEYKNDLRYYEKELEEYNTWYEENMIRIEEYKVKLEEKKQRSKKKQEDREKKLYEHLKNKFEKETKQKKEN